MEGKIPGIIIPDLLPCINWYSILSVASSCSPIHMAVIHFDTEGRLCA